MIYQGLDADYPFNIPVPLCPARDYCAEELGIKDTYLKTWEDDGDIPARGRTAAKHNPYWTFDEAKEVIIKGIIKMRQGL